MLIQDPLLEIDLYGFIKFKNNKKRMQCVLPVLFRLSRGWWWLGGA